MADNKKNKHVCPAIDMTYWDTKMTGPSWTPGMTADQARAAWYGWLRTLRTGAQPMARRTY